MRTPKEYSNNLRNRIITRNMLSDALYSVNKRAKNFRDAKRKYSKRADYYNNAEKAESRMNHFYEQKDKLLSLLQPVCIHKEAHPVTEKIQDRSPDFYNRLFADLKRDKVVWWSSYFRRIHYGYDDYFDPYDTEEIFFYNKLTDVAYKYYLYYPFGEHSYHNPIADPSGYDLPVIEIPMLSTTGDDISNIVSCQFVEKLIALIDSGSYKTEELAITEEDIRKDKEKHKNGRKKAFPVMTDEAEERVQMAWHALADMCNQEIRDRLCESPNGDGHPITEGEKRLAESFLEESLKNFLALNSVKKAIIKNNQKMVKGQAKIKGLTAEKVRKEISAVQYSVPKVKIEDIKASRCANISQFADQWIAEHTENYNEQLEKNQAVENIRNYYQELRGSLQKDINKFAEGRSFRNAEEAADKIRKAAHRKLNEKMRKEK